MTQLTEVTARVMRKVCRPFVTNSNDLRGKFSTETITVFSTIRTRLHVLRHPMLNISETSGPLMTNIVSVIRTLTLFVSKLDPIFNNYGSAACGLKCTILGQKSPFSKFVGALVVLKNATVTPNNLVVVGFNMTFISIASYEPCVD